MKSVLPQDTTLRVSPPTAGYLPPKAQLPGTATSPVPHPQEFNVATYVEDVASRAGLPADCPQVAQAITILKTNGFVSRKTLDSLTQTIALDYLKLPVVVWVCLSQSKEAEDAAAAQASRLTGHKRGLDDLDDDNEEGSDACAKRLPKGDQTDQQATAGKRPRRDAEDAPTAATVADRITRYCQEVGHDPAFFQVKSVNLVYCLVCNKTFKLHGRGQITRVKRHIKGEGKNGLSRHMHNLLSVKEKMCTQQLPMLWQIPAHILQQVQQHNQRQQPHATSSSSSTSSSTSSSSAAASSLLSPNHLHPMLANILPATGSPRSRGSSPSHSPSSSSSLASPSSLSALSLGLGGGPSPRSSSSVVVGRVNGGLSNSFLSTPIFGQAMAAVPSLQMLQSPPQDSPPPPRSSRGSPQPQQPQQQHQHQHQQQQISPAVERKRLDSETGMVHCHCLSPAKPVLVRDQPSVDMSTGGGGDGCCSDPDDSCDADFGGGAEGGGEVDEDEDEPGGGGGSSSSQLKQVYICDRKQCAFVQPNDFAVTTPLDDSIEVLDIHDSTLQSYVDQRLGEDENQGEEEEEEGGEYDEDKGGGGGFHIHQIDDADVGTEVAGDEGEEEVLVEPIPEQVVKDVSEALSTEAGGADHRRRGRGGSGHHHHHHHHVDDDEDDEDDEDNNPDIDIDSDDDEAAMRSELVMDVDDDDDHDDHHVGGARRGVGAARHQRHHHRREVELNEGGTEGLS